MAKKRAARPMTRKAPKTSVLSRLPGDIKKLQRDAQSLLQQTRKETARLTQDQKRALGRVVTQAQQLRKDFDGLVKRTSKDLESRSKRFLSTVQQQAEKRLEPVLKRVLGGELASRDDVQALARRVHALEERLGQHTHAEPSPAAIPEPPVAAETEPTTSET